MLLLLVYCIILYNDDDTLSISMSDFSEIIAEHHLAVTIYDDA